MQKGVSNMAQISIRIDDDLKTRADALFEELGLNMTTALNMFVRQTVRQGGIPFEITTRVDPFYTFENQTYLKKTIDDYEAGRCKPIVRTMTELEQMANE